MADWRKYAHRGVRIVCAKLIGWIADQLQGLHDWLIEDVWAEHYERSGLNKVNSIEDLNKLGRDELLEIRNKFPDEWRKDWDDSSMDVYDEVDNDSTR